MAKFETRAAPDDKPESGARWTMERVAAWANASRLERGRLTATGLPSFEEALAISEEIAALSRGEPAQASRLAGAMVELTRAGDASVIAVARRCRAHTFRRLARYRDALRDYAHALNEFDRLGLKLEFARTAIGTVDALGHMGRDRDAHRLAARARRVFIKSGEEGRAARLDVNLGLISVRAGKPTEALTAYRRAATIFDRANAETDLAMTRFNEANALVTLDRYEDALSLYRQSAETWRSLGAAATLGRCQLAIGSVLFRLGRLNEAMQLLEETSEAAMHLDDPGLTATASLDLARAELLTDRLEPLAARLDTAIREFKSLAMHPDQAESLGMRGMLHLKRERLNEALDDWGAAGDVYRGIGHKRGAAWADVWRAATLAKLGRRDESQTLLRKAVRTLGREGPSLVEMEARLLLAEQAQDDRPDRARRELSIVARRLRTLRDPWIEYRLWISRARLALRAGDSSGAKRSVERAYRLARRLQNVSPLESLQATWLGLRNELYHVAIHPGHREDAEWLFHWSERARASRAPIDEVATGHSQVHGRVDPDVEAFEEAREELYWLDARERSRRLDEAARGPGRARQLASWRRKRAQAMARLERHGRRLELRAARDGRLARYAEPDPKAIRAALGDGEALLEFLIAEDRLLSFVVSRDSIEVLTSRESLQAREAAVRLRQVWERYRLGPAFVRRHEGSLDATTAHLLQELRALLLDPVLPRLASVGRRMIVSPHGWLRTVPFHALLDDSWEITYARSGQSLVSARLGSATGQRDRFAAPASQALVVGVSSPDAPSAEREARAVAREYTESELLVGREATPDAVRARWPSADIIHVAAHGTLQLDDPRLSGLQLSGGAWTVHDLRAVETRARLVVLSSCHSGETVLWGTDHQMGLLPALFERSAPVAVVSLWPVDDETTGILMSAFHHELSSGRSVTEALRSARHIVREVKPAPYYWAPFVAYGADRRRRTRT